MQIVGQKPSNKIFNGKIINSFGIALIVAGNGLIHFVHCKFSDGQRYCLQGFFAGNFADPFTDEILNIMLN